MMSVPHLAGRTERAVPLWMWLASATLIVATRMVSREHIPGAASTFLLAGPLLIWTAFSPVVIVATERIARFRPWPHGWASHGALALLLSAVQLAALRALFGRDALQPFGLDGVGAVLYGLLVYAAVAAPVLLLLDGKKLAGEELRAAELTRDHERARFLAFSARLPEAFLRSVFATLAALAPSRPAAAASLLKTFSAYLRELLRAMTAARWTLRQETSLILHYGAVSEDLSPGGRMMLTVDVPPALEDLAVFPGELHAAVARVFPDAHPGGEACLVLRAAAGDAIRVHLEAGDVTLLDQLVRVMPDEARTEGALGAPVPAASPPPFSDTAVCAAGLAVAWSFGALQYVARGGTVTLPVLLLGVFHYALPLAMAVPFAPLLQRLRHPGTQAVATFSVSLAAAFGSGYVYLAPFRWFSSAAPDLSTVSALRLVLSSVGPRLIVTCAVLLLIVTLSTRRRRAAAAVARVELERQLAEARLALLRSQLRPHFLFNALNSVATLLGSDPATARAMIERMQAFYSTADAVADRPMMALGQEIALVREYIGIESVRFGERLTTGVHLEPEVAGAAVPSFLLQPLVENAVKHGIARHGGSGFVRVRAEKAGGRLRITITNSGAPGTGASPDALGLKNTRRRLETAFGAGCSLLVEGEEGTTRVTITLPIVAAIPERP